MQILYIAGRIKIVIVVQSNKHKRWRNQIVSFFWETSKVCGKILKYLNTSAKISEKVHDVPD